MISFLIVRLVDLYTLIIFIYVIMSWLPINRGVIGDIYEALGKICDPYLNLFRRFIPPIGGFMDVSPIVAVLVLQFGARLLLAIL